MIACSVNKVTKMYGGNTIFENISLEIQVQERVGLVGPNGSGKTTLLKLLAGEETTDSGQIHWKKGTQIGYLRQIPNFSEGLTTKDVLMTAFVNLLEMGEKMQAIIINKVKEFSPGEISAKPAPPGKESLFPTERSKHQKDRDRNLEWMAKSLHRKSST